MSLTSTDDSSVAGVTADGGSVVGITHLYRWWQCGWHYSPLQMMVAWLVLLTSTDDDSVVGVLTSTDDTSVVGITHLCR